MLVFVVILELVDLCWERGGGFRASTHDGDPGRRAASTRNHDSALALLRFATRS